MNPFASIGPGMQNFDSIPRPGLAPQVSGTLTVGATEPAPLARDPRSGDVLEGRDGSKNAQEPEQEQEKPFCESSHTYLVNPDDFADSSWILKACSASLIVLQFYVYYVIFKDAVQSYDEDQVAVTVDHEYCAAKGDATNLRLKCSAEDASLLNSVVGIVLIVVAIFPEIAEAGAAVVQSKEPFSRAVAVVLVLETLAAFATANASVSALMYAGNVAEGVSAGVGILFVHSLDDCAFKALKFLPNRTQQHVCIERRDAITLVYFVLAFAAAAMVWILMAM